jgi:hypothetical protein
MGRVVPPPTLGLLELVGDRTPLTRMPGAELESASWKPTATWYASKNLTFLFPKCSAPDLVDCDTAYSIKTTSAVQEALWASQNPPDCENARYMVLDAPWPHGLGSSLHIHMYMLAIAIRCVFCFFLFRVK